MKKTFSSLGFSKPFNHFSPVSRVFSEHKILKQNQLTEESSNLHSRSFKRTGAPSIYTGGDFESLVTQSSIFVDKSLLIQEVIEDPSQAILITMPRRWGKSLNLDMLKRFLSVEEGNPSKKELNRKIFEQEIKTNADNTPSQLNISTKKLLVVDEDNVGQKKEIDALALQGQDPVIFIDFQDCKGATLLAVESNLKDKIVKTVKQFSYLTNSTQLYEKTTIGQSYDELLNITSSGKFNTAIKELSALLHAYHGKKVWILIDEYDSPVNKAYLEFNNTDVKVVTDLFREVFESSLKGNEHLKKGVITGVQYIVKSGMLSGLNNLSKYNATNIKYSKYYGINQEEMRILVEHFGINPEIALKIKDWYNGYKGLELNEHQTKIMVDKYNIWSVINYLNRQEDGFKSYWENNSLGEVINKKIIKHPLVKETIENLINNTNLVLSTLFDDFSFENFQELKAMTTIPDQVAITQDGIDLLFSYLFITGYLTKVSHNEYVLPNKEIKTEFEQKIKEYYNQIFNISPVKFNELTKVLSSVFAEKDVNKVSTIFQEEFGPGLSNLISELKLYSTTDNVEKGLFGNEDLMHSLLNNIAIQVVNAKFASERYTIKPDNTKGRADIVLEKNNIGIAIEMKYNAKDVQDALNQAKQYKELVKDSEIQVFIGCNITDQQEVFLSGEIVCGDNSTHFMYP